MTPAAGFTRPALAPGILLAIVLIAGVALIDTDWFISVRFVATILALILCVFAMRGRTWWALPLLAAIAVFWNPIVVLPIEGQGWQAMHYAGALVAVVAGVRTRVPTGTTSP
ncbi:DUF6804 family protein [Planctomonas psychrotolerans]|uniref:DUF6804 family protein n=1 Tax=Planctomonas psychrotolerans TaxID=2528712 RepID=UPI0012389617|nr:DUF6804 family protein [Planctomonas psychrotolerans]